MKNNIFGNTHFAFNVWDFNSAKFLLETASDIKRDLIIQTSSGIFEKLPARQFRDFIKSYADELGINVWLNLDHCKDEDLLTEAIGSGWDMVMVDGSHLPIDENIDFTNRIAEKAHMKDVLVEAEVGQVMGVEDDLVVDKAVLASRDDIKLFLEKTEIDFIAVAFGNAHGEYKAPPELDYDLVEYTTALSCVPFVVHGGSGLSADVLKRLISIEGVKKINISTEVKQAYREGIINAVRDGAFEKNGFQPVNVEKYLKKEFNKLVSEKYKLIDNVNG